MENKADIRVRVPASSANLGPGFDTLALALGLHLTCTVRRSSGGLKIRASGVDTGEIPCDASNLVFQSFLRAGGDESGDHIELEIENELPLGRGLGSSAAAILAGLALGSEWSGRKRGKEEIIQMAAALEGHPDNVAAAALGGLVVSCQRQDGSVLAVNCAFDSRLQVVLVVPECRLSTEAARAALPEKYSRQDAVFNLQRVALLMAAFRDGRPEVFAEAMRDRLHQPYRAPLVPGFDEALTLSNVPGLLGVALSGAGPSVVAFCNARAGEIGEMLAGCFQKRGVRAEARQLAVDREGLIIERVASGSAAMAADRQK